MMTRKCLWMLLAIAIAGLVPAAADTFKNKKTGEIFYGFRTQKSSGSKVLVYNDGTGKSDLIDPREYDITQDDNGRRNSVVLVNITDPEVMLSGAVTRAVADAIIKGSNTGPQFILLKIDNPGGRGEYMKELCSTVSNTDNCKVVAYISGGPCSGAHSAAAVLAMVCDKVFIAPTATISAVSPFLDASVSDEFTKIYGGDTLTSFSLFASTLAETKQRPVLLAKALLDKKLALVEVVNADGKQDIVEKDLRQPNQVIVKTLCDGFSMPAEKSDKNTTLPADIYARVLNLTPADAVRFKFADKIVNSERDILDEMNATNVQFAKAPGIDTVVKQFVAARKNILRNLTQIETLEDRTATLEDQFNAMESQLRSTPNTVERKMGYKRGRVLYGESSQGAGVAIRNSSRTDSTNSTSTRNSSRTDSTNSTSTRGAAASSEAEISKSVTSQEPSVDAERARMELSYVLVDLISEYRQTINLAKRWEGALPMEITVQTLEKNMNSAMALSDNLRYRQINTNNMNNMNNMNNTNKRR